MDWSLEPEVGGPLHARKRNDFRDTHTVAAGLLLIGTALLGLTRGQQATPFLRLTPEQSEILNHMSMVYLDDGQGGMAKTIRFTDVNVQVVNGLGATNGYSADPSEIEGT